MAAPSVFDQILASIVRGQYGPGARLPSERDLARTLGASRPTLREALKRLEQWNLLSTRRGSGATVRDLRKDATLDVLPAYLRFGAIALGPERLGRVVEDVLRLRRGLVVETVRTLGDRLPPGSLDGARRSLHASAALRGQRGFVAADLEVMRQVFSAADFLPGQWLLNSIQRIYVEIGELVTARTVVPENYVPAHEAAFQLLEAGDVEGAAKGLGDYLAAHDDNLLAALGLSPSKSRKVPHAV